MNMKMKKKGRNSIYFLAWIMASLLFFPASVHAETKPLKVALLNYPNYIEKTETGEVRGYAYEYLQEISAYTGWNYEFIEMPLAEANEKLNKGEIDIVAGNQYTEERAEKCDFSESNMGMGGSVLCTALDNKKYAYNDLKGYEGMKIGALKGSVRNLQTKELFEKYNIHVTIVEYDSDAEVKEALKEGLVDTILMSIIRCERDYMIVANLSATPLYFSLNQQKPYVKEGIDRAMNYIHMENPYFELELMQKYYGNIISTHTFTLDEKAYLKSNTVLKVGICNNWVPLEYYDEEKKEYKGIVPDIFKRIQEKTGITIEYVGFDNLRELEEALNEGKIQAGAVLTNDKEWGERNNVHLTEPFFAAPMVTIYSINSETQDRIAITKNDGVADKIKEGGEGRILYYDTTFDCIEAVRKGEADCTLANTYETNYYLNMPKYSNLSFRSQIDFNQVMSVAVPEDADSRLYRILSKTLDDIPEEERRLIIRENTENIIHFSAADIFLNDPLAIITMLLVFLLILTIMFVLFTLYRLNRKKNKILLRTNAAKTDFLSRMSHEIRTPLSAIIGMNDIIFGSTMEETTQKCSEKIAISSNHLLQLVNDVLDMNKISEGKVELTPAIFHLGKMLNTIEVVYAEAAREKNIEFRMDLLSEISPYVIGDELRLKQVLINLISNALKYNKANGKILLQIKQVKEFDGKQKLFFSVIDNGIGISKENLPIVFDAFEREKRSDINAITGSGLGLSISAQIVKLMGSELKVDSELGKGSNFYFTILLPLASEEDYRNMRKEKVETDAISLNGKNILIAEDNTINAEIIKNLLEIKNASVTIAENGEKAVKLFEVSEINYYTVIIMDIRMPIMNGYEATRKIRSLNRLDAKKIPIIALSANAFAEDKLQSLDAGMNEHLSKPIDREEVYRTIAKYLKS